MFLSETIWDLSWSSAKPNTVDLKIWSLSQNAVSCKANLVSVLCSAQETIHQVVGDMLLLTFTFVDIVLELPEIDRVQS